ncbi:ATP-binding protein [Methanomassiliicoccales archaeon LGM-DZ1]|nr:ATP-binding protein [Methanomassiliicoccales archaeon LGM-DZ1]
MAEDDGERPAETAAGREISLFMKARSGCIILLAISVVCAAISAAIGEYKALYLSVPSGAIAAVSLRRSGGFYMPMAIDAILAAVLVMQMGARWTFKYNGGMWWLDPVSDFVMGMFLCLIGIILVYILVRRMPGLDRENGIISATAFSFGFSMSTLIILCSFVTSSFVEGHFSGSQGFASAGEMTSAIIGAGAMSILFYLNRNSLLFQNTVEAFLRGNADAIGIDELEKDNILRRISGGETSVTEFKSTIRTNLHTGEKDPRMEKAVLKTIVAFLNSRGGTLLIGVSDDGTIIGVDEKSFESRDKMMLHLNNLIKSQIGSQYLPYISYKAVDFDSGTVIRVDCRPSDSPCFLIEGKTETFYVRSGPSSIDLHGNDLLSYANHNFDKQLRKMYKPKVRYR